MPTEVKERPVNAEAFLPSHNLSAADEPTFKSIAADYATFGKISDVIGKFDDKSQAEAVTLVLEVMGLTTKRLSSGKSTAKNFAALITAIAQSENFEDSMAHALQLRANLGRMASDNAWARYTPAQILGFGSQSAADIARTVLNTRDTRSSVVKKFREAGKAGA